MLRNSKICINELMLYLLHILFGSTTERVEVTRFPSKPISNSSPRWTWGLASRERSPRRIGWSILFSIHLPYRRNSLIANSRERIIPFSTGRDKWVRSGIRLHFPHIIPLGWLSSIQEWGVGRRKKDLPESVATSLMEMALESRMLIYVNTLPWWRRRSAHHGRRS